MIRTIIDFWLRPNFRNFDLATYTFYCTCLCLGAYVGSAVSIFVSSASIYATFQLAIRRLKWALPRPVSYVYLAVAGFFAADLIAAMINPSVMAFQEVFENLPFLGVAGIYSINFVDRARLLDSVETVAAGASLMAIPVTFFLFDNQLRSEMATGNPGVLALVAAILFMVNVGAAGRSRDRSSLLHLACAACAAYLVILSGTRGMWLALILVPLLGLIVYQPPRRVLMGLPVLVLLLGGGAALLANYSHMVETRLGDIAADLEAMRAGDMSGSIGQRIRIYEAGYELVLEKPFFGYGPGNEREALAAMTLELGGQSISYSHAHNAVLSALLRSGLVGLAALAALVVVPVVVASRARKDAIGKAGFFILSGMMVVYVCSGTVGLMLGNDMHDAVFIATLCFSLYLVFGHATPPAAAGPDQ